MRRIHLICLISLLLAVVGCGGSGTSSGGGGNSAAGGAIFATDSMNDKAHVWVTIEKIVLLSASGNVTAYDDPVGTSVDLRSLRDANGNLFSWLTNVPEGTYTGIQVTVAKDVVIYANGSSTGVTKEFAGNNGTTATLSLNFAQPRLIGPNNHFVLDFDLGDWDDNGAQITGTPFLREGDGNGLNNPDRHEHDEIEGTVSGLTGTAPDQTFVLVRGHSAVNVSVNAQTIIFTGHGSTTSSLQNGEHVTVDGAFSTTANAIVADWLQIRNAGDHGHHNHANGTVSNINTANGTFTLTLNDAHGFMPGTTEVTVATDANTDFRGRHGATFTQTEFFALLQAGAHVQVEGTLDASGTTMTATMVRLDESNVGDEAELTGPVSNVLTLAHTFDVTAHEWEGMDISNGSVVHIATTGSTTYRNNGTDMNVTDFFMLLAQSGGTVEVQGTFDANTSTMTATRIRLGGEH